MRKSTIAIVFIILSTLYSKQKALSQTYRPTVKFAMERTDSRFMLRQKGYYNADTNNINGVYGFTEYKKLERDAKFRSPIMLGVLLNHELTNFHTSDVKSYTKDFVCYVISDSSDVKIIAAGITSDNYKDYKYHVVKNDSVEIIPWTSVSVSNLEKRYGVERPFANLGTYNSPGDQILVEVVNKNDYSIRDGIIFDWRVDFTPRVTQISVLTNKDKFNLNFSKLNRGWVSQFDPKSGMPLNLAFPVDSIDNFRFYFENHETVPYAIFLKKEIASRISVEYLDYEILGNYYDFSSKFFKEPGKYELTIHRIGINRNKEDQKLHFKFEVLSSPVEVQSFTLLQVVYFGAAIILLFALVFLVYYLVNKRKRAKLSRQKQLIDLKLKAIQAQLNPHFMFNALSSIQNLMNKNEVEEANLFLGKFSKLTRQVLDAGDEEMISLEDELLILEEYLYMEQLRFNFSFRIKTDDAINKANTEVPAMLLHPFIENAVKHGVAPLGKDGKIELELKRDENNLLMQITDNGSGFSEEAIGENSLGIKLVKERIKLLNQLYDHQFELKIESASSGTKIVLILKSWF
ncbi:sensor histidine kinase [Maribellus mangrovi]|uniref:sensor histidine kinase n=1 Tax=Maribellus mangrovi TaxID=3133146 RepID=UPI0030ED00B4